MVLPERSDVEDLETHDPERIVLFVFGFLSLPFGPQLQARVISATVMFTRDASGHFSV